jgi:hypothetical protein
MMPVASVGVFLAAKDCHTLVCGKLNEPLQAPLIPVPSSDFVIVHGTQIVDMP